MAAENGQAVVVDRLLEYGAIVDLQGIVRISWLWLNLM